MAAEHVLHMQKALDQMNLQIHRVLNDITGVSGLKILDAILTGERDPLTLARLCHGGVKNSEDTIAKSLEGDYRPEHLFALRQSLAAYHYYQKLVLEVDQEIKLQLGELQTAQRSQHPHEQRLLHINGADMSQRHLTFVGSCIASSEWI
jgi:transposase